jgi:hypothetical protein
LIGVVTFATIAGTGDMPAEPEVGQALLPVLSFRRRVKSVERKKKIFHLSSHLSFFIGGPLKSS